MASFVSKIDTIRRKVTNIMQDLRDNYPDSYIAGEVQRTLRGTISELYTASMQAAKMEAQNAITS